MANATVGQDSTTTTSAGCRAASARRRVGVTPLRRGWHAWRRGRQAPTFVVTRLAWPPTRSVCSTAPSHRTWPLPLGLAAAVGPGRCRRALLAGRLQSLGLRHRRRASFTRRVKICWGYTAADTRVNPTVRVRMPPQPPPLPLPLPHPPPPQPPSQPIPLPPLPMPLPSASARADAATSDGDDMEAAVATTAAATAADSLHRRSHSLRSRNRCRR